MILIPSSQYLRAEIQNEIGMLPPSLSFLKNQRLYEFQLKLVKKFWDKEKILITLPEKFILEKLDHDQINNLGADIKFCLSEVSLGKHIANIIEENNPQTLKILHGDTLFLELPTEDDIVVVGKPHETADWDVIKIGNSELVWAGFFSFSDPKFFLKELKANEYSFDKAIYSYGHIKKLKYIENRHWYDFGHLEELHRAREKFTTERVFNNLQINKYEVKKISKKRSKIFNEYNWFQKMPSHLQKFLPNVYNFVDSKDEAQYSMSYISGFSLSELMLFSNLSETKWNNILRELLTFIQLQETEIPKNSMQLSKEYMALIDKKNNSRVEDMIGSEFISANEDLIMDGYSLGSIYDIISELSDIIKKQDCIPAFCHGDLCFSNLIYLSRGNIIKLIDPRGVDSQLDSVIGDKRYDLAKLAHSLIWGYDRILFGDITFKRSGNEFKETTKIMKNKNQEVLKKISTKLGLNKILLREDIVAITSLLFISMIPLHADSLNRQESLFGNGLKIFQEIKEGKYKRNV